MSEYKVCKLCILKYGLTGQSLSDKTCNYAFKTSEELINHLKQEHNITTAKLYD
jgi:hypothetical protein